MTEGGSIRMLFLPQWVGCVTLLCLIHSWSPFQRSLPHVALLVTFLLFQVCSLVKPTLVHVGQVSVCSSCSFYLVLIVTVLSIHFCCNGLHTYSKWYSFIYSQCIDLHLEDAT